MHLKSSGLCEADCRSGYIKKGDDCFPDSTRSRSIYIPPARLKCTGGWGVINCTHDRPFRLQGYNDCTLKIVLNVIQLR
jgi:hypothetical protein